MRLAQVYSHLNGLEFLLVRKPELWEEVQSAVHEVDASLAFEKVSQEKTMKGRILFSPSKLNKLFRDILTAKGWHELRTDYFVNEDLNTTREVIHLRDKDQQKRIIIENGFTPYRTHNQVDFVKDSVALEVPNELANIVREGRSNPSVPIILAGIEP